MPANEAMELDRALRGHGFPAGPLFLNGYFASRFSQRRWPRSPAAGRRWRRRARRPTTTSRARSLSAHYEQVAARGNARELVRIPFLFDRAVRRASIEKVAAAIGGVL